MNSMIQDESPPSQIQPEKDVSRDETTATSEILRISQHITEIIRQLRKGGATFVDPLPPLDEPVNMLGPHQSIGPWPAYYFPSICPNCAEGSLCSVCGYTTLDLHIPRKAIVDSAISQFDSIMDNYEENVIDGQFGEIYAPGIDRPVGLTLSPTGSWFGSELPRKVRIDMLRELVRKMREWPDLELVLYIEAHARDVVKKIEAGSFDVGLGKEEMDLLKELHTNVILGFESRDDLVRNGLYDKDLEISDFEKAVSELQKKGLGVGAFVFGGLPPMTDTEVMNDVISTLVYLSEKGVFPVLMLANIQPNTIPDLLRENGKLKMLEPFTAMRIIAEMLKISMSSKNQNFLIPDPVGGPPDPEFNIFLNRTDTVSSDVTNQLLLEKIRDLRVSRDGEAFLKWFEILQQGEEYRKYLELMQQQEISKITLTERINSMLEYIESPGIIERYKAREKLP